MVSEKQGSANTQNAQKSTGPTTPEGKANISGNAIKHGLLSQVTLLAHENKDSFAELREGICSALKPMGDLEKILADRIVSCFWRLRRVISVETASVQKPGSFGLDKDDKPEHRFHSRISGTLILNRYEISIERSLFKALHELQRLQASRGVDILYPAVLDVDVSTNKYNEAV